MPDERTARRSGFTEGPRIVLGDGQEWAFPRSWLRLYPVRGADGAFALGGGPGYGADHDDLVDRLMETPAFDTETRLTLQFEMAARLLLHNYELSDRDLRRLLAIDLADPNCEARWAAINQVLLGSPPKASADGSATR
ncbi:MAG: hypothetical protein ACLP7Q_09045 [Isosphaeraceae bacterium]